MYCSLGNFPLLGNNYFLLSCDSLGIDVNSTLEGVLSTLLGKFYLATLEGVAFYVLDLWGSPSMIRKSGWGLAWWSWLIEECSRWFLIHRVIFFFIHRGYFWSLWSTEAAFEGFDLLGILFRVFMFFAYKGHFCHFWMYFWIFLYTSSLLETSWGYLIPIVV